MRASLFLLLTLAPSLAVAAGDDIADLYFTGANPVLTTQEAQALALAEKWQTSSELGAPPVLNEDGSITFLYGAAQPSIVCAVMQVCDVQLQPGEQVNSIHLGDTVRWSVEPAITGYGPNEIQHLIIKVRDVGLMTSLVVATNRRTYSLRLRSHRTQFMHHVQFTYPDDVMEKWNGIQTRHNRQREQATLPETGEYLSNLDFGYAISVDGDAVSWKPVRVYNDGIKTILQMPPAFSRNEAPTLLVVRGKDNPEEVIVNYRIQGDRYIVDTVFDRAILVAGVGRNQHRVTVTRDVK